MRRGFDRRGEIVSETRNATAMSITDDPWPLGEATFVTVAGPTPIDHNRRPDLTALGSASKLTGRGMCPGTVVESAVYPGVSEDECGPMLVHAYSPAGRRDFTLGYSPERINPGDTEHTFERTVEVVAGEDDVTLERIAGVYTAMVDAGVHRAPSIRVSEAAKVIEDTQRNLSIALMNEFALFFDRLDIRTSDVLAVTCTKWSQLPFGPGLVGGHCIGIDQNYLTSKAEEVGFHPQVILAARRINYGMGAYVAQKCVKLLASQGAALRDARVGGLGLTFKENVTDLRSSRFPDIVVELISFGVTALVHDAMANADVAQHEYAVELQPWEALVDLDAIVLAVVHRSYPASGLAKSKRMLRPDGALIDVKATIDPAVLPIGLEYWSL